MGVDFLNFVGHAKVRSLMGSLPLSGSGNHRIYVSRFGARARRMLNEQALVDALKPLGFRIIAGEGLSFADQVRTFANANFIIGAHGAGLVNAAFARPNSTLFELRPLNRYGDSPMWGMSYIKLSSIMGFAYCAHVSENEPDSEEWVANVDEILRQIRELLA
jgi:capsular polysaccharide biosynthesis protein